MRSSTVGSCASAGRYSWLTIDGGTFQVGLTVMYFISAVMIGVGISGLPMTIRVVHTCLPLCITRKVKSGRLKALGVTGATRTAQAPAIPTISESGLAGYEVYGWYGFAAPANSWARPAKLVVPAKP